MRRFPVHLLAVTAVLALPAPVAAVEPSHLIGAMHEHSGYSDGWPGSRPMDYFLSARDKHDLDFLGSGEHSTNADIPAVFNEECYEEPRPADCLIADKVNPADSFRKWDATLEQAEEATDRAKGFTGFRGFEWSSDRNGHINVYFSQEDTNSETDGSFGSMAFFYGWLTRSPAFGGGGDGLAHFNHPGDKSLCGQVDACGPDQDPAFNWEDFRYVPAADPQMVGIEVFNGQSDFASPPHHFSPPEGWYARALDRGWHVGAIGSEDKGHKRTDDWGASTFAKTVIVGASNNRSSIKEAMRRRSFYAVLDNDLRIDFAVDGAAMGSRLDRRLGAPLQIRAQGRGTSTPVTFELVTSGGRVVAEGTDGRLDTRRAAAPGERYYFLRAKQGPRVVGYSSPIWVSATAAASPGAGAPGASGTPGGAGTPGASGERLRRLLAGLGAPRRVGRGALLRGRSLTVAVRCSRNCDLSAALGVRGRRGRFRGPRLVRVTRPLRAGKRRLLRLRLGGRARRHLRARAGRSLLVRVRAVDAAGRQDRASRRIRLTD